MNTGADDEHAAHGRRSLFCRRAIPRADELLPPCEWVDPTLSEISLRMTKLPKSKARARKQ